MVRSFFESTVDDWDDPGGMLHAYLVPDAATADSVRTALDVLGRFRCLAPQPLDALHATVLRLPFLIRELSADSLRALEASAIRAAAGLGPIELDLGGPIVTGDSVLLRAQPDAAWHALVGAARTAARGALGDGALRYAAPPAPHLTLAYATTDGEDEPILSALADAGAAAPLGEVAFDAVEWCAVHQNRDAGTYTFETLIRTPL